MTPRKRSNIQKLAEISFDPLNDPQTIPAGWDVAAFFAPEMENQNNYGMMRDFSDPVDPASMRNEDSTDSLQ